MNKFPLWMQIFVAMLLGVLVGVIAGNGALTTEILRPIGTMFINLIKMLVVPLIFCSLVMGIVSMEDDFARMGRIGGRTFILYLLTTACAVSIGLAIATIFSPGTELSIPVPEIGSQETKETGSLLSNFMNTLVGLVPSNPVNSLSSGNILQIILFALLFGIAINLSGEKGRPVRVFFESAAEVMFRLTAMVMKVAPIGVFALMAWVAGKFGISVLKPLLMLIITAYVATAIHAILVIGGLVKFVGKISPMKFFKAVAEPFAFAFVSTSSSGTLPLSIAAVSEKLGVSRRVSNFVLPLGATINMDGTAIYQGVCAIFIAQAYGIDLSAAQYATIVFTCTLASIGTAGVPGAGLIMLSMVLSSAGLPLDGLAMVAGIDRILDMARTSVNVLGDCMCSVIIGHKEGEIHSTKTTQA
ncbi:dicarboxylate/amino acid:cation symporter [Suttonella ornithocola]|uniref:Glutamate-aspartate carrier protein n=1 Tax=Suttonella ornithocola TaxID=279832 RepID=A0A380MNI1_9GAMM|nr:dicarboxylate/amino acid:cation symporter [Suttonella ornithocola]SUO94185.1 Glutamate-aspartate carrier protein [Suttonella ornithocola]